MGRFYVGTSGWQYRHWRGTFYPDKVPQRAWLEALADRLDSVEVNGSFYRLPRKESVAQWAEETPRDFRFALKMWRGVTHYKKLKDPAPKLRPFFRAARALPTRQRGPILVQLPPNMGKNVERLDAFLQSFKKTSGKEHWRVAVEFRSPDWYDEETYRVLDKRRAALCLHDMKGSEVDEPNDAAFVFVRRHGPTGEAKGDYAKGRIRKDARRVRSWLDEGKTVFVYYNNDEKGYAPQNALTLKEMVHAG